MNRHFEKISFKQFKKDVSDDEKLYNDYKIPQRKTKFSAGYDFMAIEDLEIKPQEIKKIPTGIKAKFNEDEMLILINRSSYGFKYNIRLCNQVGLIDADYYNNKENEGHIWIALQNEGKETLKIKKSEGFCQGVFLNYLVTDDDDINVVREGGIGSTNE